MLFFQLVNFRSKGFNVLIFLFQLRIVTARTELKLFDLLLQLSYRFFNLLQFLPGFFINHGGAGSALLRDSLYSVWHNSPWYLISAIWVDEV